MGIGIWSKNNEDIRTHMSYGSFGKIRSKIALAYNYELGCIMNEFLSTIDESKRIELGKRFDSIYATANRKAKIIMRFLCKKDTGASANKFMCKAIMELKNEILENNKDNEDFVNFYLNPFFLVVEDGCKKGIEWA